MNFLFFDSSETVAPTPVEPAGRLRVDGEVFRDEAGAVWGWHGATQFLLFRRWLAGENIDSQIAWMRQQRITVARVLGMVAWSGQAFGPTVGWSMGSYWDELPRFVAYLRVHGIRVEFTVFADAQILMPDRLDQQAHLRRVVDTIGYEPSVFLEICNEPFKNGVTPARIIEGIDAPCPMASGDYLAAPPDAPILTGLLLDYCTPHLPRSRESWSRKAKDLKEYRDLVLRPDRARPLQVPCVSDEPMGAAEIDQVAGRQRSADPAEHFWHHAVCAIFGAGSTFHSDAGLQAVVPPEGGAQQACADAVSFAWSRIEPVWQTGHYTAGHHSTCPLVFDPALFPEDTSRIYGMILGDRACCVAVKPDQAWVPVAQHGWRLVSTHGPQNSLVFLER